MKIVTEYCGVYTIGKKWNVQSKQEEQEEKYL